MGKEKYSYELLIIDDSGKSEITTEKRLLRAISYSGKLWGDDPIISDNQIIDDKTKITLEVKSADLHGSLSELEYSSVFFVFVTSSNFETLEKFRKESNSVRFF